MVGGNPMGAESTEISQRLDQISFSLAVVPDEQVRSGAQVEVNGGVVSEVRETEPCNDHDKRDAVRFMLLFRLFDGVSAELVTKGSDSFHGG